MNKTFKKYMAASAIVMAGGIASAAHAADSVNVAFFLEWATPNQIAKVDKVYDDAMGVDVNWTDFSTGVQMTGQTTPKNMVGAVIRNTPRLSLQRKDRVLE